MKSLIKKILIWLLSFDKIGAFIKWYSITIWKIKYQRELIERRIEEKELNDFAFALFSNKTVLNGPFKDMVYPSMRSKSSSLFSKLIGSYERELEDNFIEIINTKYEQIIDIGCAEGYYAVGFALKMPQVKVFAYDIDKEARELTKQMAVLNHVNDRVMISSNCTAQTLKNFDYTKKTLIISDCEGYERFLFNEVNINSVKNVDLLIETHDWVDITISSNLEELFQSSHEVKIIQSVSDVYKAKNYHYPELKSLSLKEKYRMFEEGRRFVDEWLILKHN